MTETATLSERSAHRDTGPQSNTDERPVDRADQSARYSSVYIMGRGHSGSTILSSLLGHLDSVNDVGELIYPMDKLCGCGASFDDCTFWSEVRTRYESGGGRDWSEDLQLVREQAHFSNFFSTLFRGKGNPATVRLRDINERLTREILETAGVGTLLDSSKQPTRALFLMKHSPETRFLHIVRAPESYLESYVRRMKRGQISFMRKQIRTSRFNPLVYVAVIFSWIVANLQAEVVRLFDSERVLRIRYEDLTEDVQKELGRVASFLELDLRGLIDDIENSRKMQVGHIIGGNDHIRSASGFVFEPKIGKQSELPSHYVWLARLLTWPLMLRYGYRVLRAPA